MWDQNSSVCSPGESGEVKNVVFCVGEIDMA